MFVDPHGNPGVPRLSDLPKIGWREWLALPDLEVARIKAKVDTGARSSALHAFDLQTYPHRGEDWVRFSIHPKQHRARPERTFEMAVLEYRKVKSSGGHESLRPVIVTRVELLGHCWEIELTLAARDTMGFRMLLGRQAIRSRFVVDTGASYYNGKPSWPTAPWFRPRKGLHRRDS